MSAANAAFPRGEVARITGAGGGRRVVRRLDFRAAAFLAAAFFAAALRAADVVCFFLLACDVDGCGATAKAVSNTTARALSLRYCIFVG
jgi:hypothetical protein